MPIENNRRFLQHLRSYFTPINEFFLNVWQEFNYAKLPLYGIVWLLLFYLAAPLGLSIAFKAAITFCLAPIVFEVTARFLNGILPSFRGRQPIPVVPVDYRRNSVNQRHPVNQHDLVDQIIQAATSGNIRRATMLISQLTAPLCLYNAASRSLGLQSRRTNEIFPRILARIGELGHSHYLIRDQNMLIRTALRNHQDTIVAQLFRVPEIIQRIERDPHLVLDRLRRNNDLANLELMLNYPRIVAQLTHDNNRLLRNAQRSEHFDFAARLLAIANVANFEYPPDFHDPDVESEFPQFAGGNVANSGNDSSSDSDSDSDSEPELDSEPDRDLYVNEELDGDLRDIATDDEGSMAELNPRQLQALNDMEQKYQALFRQKGGVNAIFEEIRNYLRTEYQKAPACEDNGTPLPLLFTHDTAPQNKIPYYRHVVHSAYRYLFMHPNPLSRFYPEDENIPANDKLRIAYMWVAATDPSLTLLNGQTRESLLEEFSQSIYELCRAHNFDGTHWVTKTRRNPQTNREERYRVEEHYDDLRRDNPTCGWGVTQRITQFYMVFLNDRPETRALTPEVMRTKFQEQMINESEMEGCLFKKLNRMNTNTLQAILDAMEKEFVLLEETTTVEKELINRLCFSETEVYAFIEHCHAYFGPYRIDEERNEENKINFGTHRFNNFEQMIRHLAGNTAGGFYLDIERNIKNILNSRPPETSSPQEQNALPEEARANVLSFNSRQASRTENEDNIAAGAAAEAGTPTPRPRRRARRH